MKLSEEKLFSYLINRFNFVVEEFFIEELNEKQFIALNYSEDGVYGIVFSNDSNKNLIGKSAFYYLKDKGKSFALNNVIFTKRQDVSDEISNFYNGVYFNENTEKIISYDAGCEFLIEVIKSLNNINSKKKVSLSNMPSKITAILIGINLIMFIISAIMSGSIIDIKTGVLVELGAKINPLIANGQYFRLLTAMFLHGGLMHILFNMYALYALGNFVEEAFGKVGYLIIYFVSGILSTFASYFFSAAISVGASGAIFGLLGACLTFAIFKKNKIGKQFLFDILSVIVLNIVIGISSPDIDNFAHIGGLISGSLISLIIMNFSVFKKEIREK